MELLVLFAFLAGVVTVVSPCVLPVLPALLATSSAGRAISARRHSAGACCRFYRRDAGSDSGSSGARGAYRVVACYRHRHARLLRPNTAGATARTLDGARAFPAYPHCRSRPASRSSGFWGGTAIGAGLGLLWAPCVGPIMASVLGLTALAGVTPAAVAITLSYSLGAALPMLLIAYGGRTVASRARTAGRHSTVVRQLFGGLTVLACIALLLGADTQLQTLALANLPPEWNAALTGIERRDDVQAQIGELQKQTENQPKEMAAMTAPTQSAQPAQPTEPTQLPVQPTALPISTSEPKIALADLGPAPDMTGITQWFNSGPLSLQQLRGKVVIVDFWTFDCINCRNTMPYVKDLYKKYHDQGLEILGVHTPELSFEYIPENVKAAIKDQGITWPVAFDPNYSTWNAYNNRYWPAFYFVDAKGHIRYTHFGEGNYDYNEKVVQQLLTEASK